MSFLTLADYPGVFADALLYDDDDQLLFASLWARDMPILELLARIQLSEEDTTQDDPTLHFATPDGRMLVVSIRSPERFRRLQGRTPQACVFGSLTHTWIYDRLLLDPDLAQQRAIMVYRETDEPEACEDRLWGLVLRTCSVPLLRAWKVPVLAAFRDHGFVTRIDGFGVRAFRLHLSAAEPVIGDLVRSGHLTAEESTSR